MKKEMLTYSPISSSRRQLLLAASATLLCPTWAFAGVQREETLSDDVASLMRNSINHTNPPRLIFANPKDGEDWLSAMSHRLAYFIADTDYRHRLLINIHYEASRADLNPQIILGLIEIESAFRQYAMSSAGARGLMQVMPFWKKHIGKPSHNLFDIRTNLRYGCTILRHYRQVEKGDLIRALARFHGSLGSHQYPNAVLKAWRNRWQWH